MQKKNSFVWWVVLSSLIYAQNTTLKLQYETLDFEHSKKKDDGKRVGIAIDHQDGRNRYQLAYEKTDTDTFKPPLTKDLKVDKYYAKYTRRSDDKQAFTLSYGYIDDNLMKETTHGRIYGVGYQYGTFGITQYLSDYKHFNVYQSEVKYTRKRDFETFKGSMTLIGKYIHLQDKNSNNFSKNAKENYFTPGIKLHAGYKGYHFGVGAFFGKRIFAVMNDGFKVQHHAMEFKQTYMCGVGKHFQNGSVHLKYVYQKASEVPIHNDNVKVRNIIVQAAYRF